MIKFSVKKFLIFYTKWKESRSWPKASCLKQGSETNVCRPRRCIASQTSQKCSPWVHVSCLADICGCLVWSLYTHHLKLAWWGGTAVFLWGRLRYKYRSLWGRNKLRSEIPCYSSTLRPYPIDRTVSYSFLNDVYLFFLMWAKLSRPALSFQQVLDENTSPARLLYRAVCFNPAEGWFPNIVWY